MFFRRAVIEAGGGIAALGAEPAEDAAATKLIRRHGLRVRLVDKFFAQPIPERTLSEVWSRQLRWAKLRRASFAAPFVGEILTGSAVPLSLTALACISAGISPLPVMFALTGIWYGTEHLLERAVGWPGTLYTISPAMPCCP